MGPPGPPRLLATAGRGDGLKTSHRLQGEDARPGRAVRLCSPSCGKRWSGARPLAATGERGCCNGSSIVLDGSSEGARRGAPEGVDGTGTPRPLAGAVEGVHPPLCRARLFQGEIDIPRPSGAKKARERGAGWRESTAIFATSASRRRPRSARMTSHSRLRALREEPPRMEIPLAACGLICGAPASRALAALPVLKYASILRSGSRSGARSGRSRR